MSIGIQAKQLGLVGGRDQPGLVLGRQRLDDDQLTGEPPAQVGAGGRARLR